MNDVVLKNFEEEAMLCHNCPSPIFRTSPSIRDSFKTYGAIDNLKQVVVIKDEYKIAFWLSWEFLPSDKFLVFERSN